MLITFNGRYNYKTNIYILLVICYIIKSLDDYEKFLDQNILKTNNIKNFISSLISAVFDRNFYIFSIIFYIIEQKKIKSNKIVKTDSSINNINRISFIKRNNNVANYIKSICLIFICFLISIILYAIKISDFHIKLYFTSLAFAFLTLFFFNFILLHKKIYKHHKLSLFVMVLFNIPLFIYYCFNVEIEREIYNIFYFIGYTIIFIIYQFIIEKYYMSVYFVFFIEGLFNIISTIIILIIKIKKNYEFNLIFKYYIINNIFYFSFQLMNLLNIYYFSPTKCISADIFARSLLILCYEIYKIDYENNIFRIICDLILNPLNLIMVLIYDEIIILNFCGLNENTEENIIIRQQIDLKILNDNKNEKETKNVDNSLN